MIKIDISWEGDRSGIRYAKLGLDTRSLLEQGLDHVAAFSVEALRKRTPGEKLPDGWVAQKRDSPKGLVLKRFITNTDKRAYKLIKLRNGGRTNLLEILEYGTNPTMPIFPVKAKALRFVAKSGDVVFAAKVNPKGIRAYSMVRSTRHDTHRKVRGLRDVIRNHWERKYGTK